MALRRGLASSQDGQSVVETALFLPLLALVLLGVADGARLLLAGVTLQTAVMAGAQYGALSPQNAVDSVGIDAAVRNEMRFPQAGASNPGVSSATATDASGELRVSVNGAFTLTTIFAYPGLPQSFTFSRVATVQVRR